jgi:hypothetical protein
MIVDWLDSQWIYVLPSNPNLPYRGKYDFPKTKEEYLQHWGKWVISGERKYLDELAHMLDPYVEAKYIYPIKYLRQAPFWIGFEQPAMCVYCDDREKEDIWRILSNLGVTHKQWIYEEETIASWQPGGELFQRMVAYRKLSPEESARVGKKFQLWNERWLSHLFEEGDKDQGIWNFEQMVRKLTWESFKRKDK